MNSFPLQITVFISSPSDLSPERSALLQLFEQLNTNVAKYRFKVFVLVYSGKLRMRYNPELFGIRVY
jgi:hypothetical protein